jgi:hypothetical protein
MLVASLSNSPGELIPKVAESCTQEVPEQFLRQLGFRASKATLSDSRGYIQRWSPLGGRPPLQRLPANGSDGQLAVGNERLSQRGQGTVASDSSQ